MRSMQVEISVERRVPTTAVCSEVPGARFQSLLQEPKTETVDPRTLLPFSH